MADHLISVRPDRDVLTPPGYIDESFEATLPAQSTCNQIEFKYSFYYVPRGMEGFLLSRVFGQWQSWNSLSQDNYLKNKTLQAGQKLRMKLPLYSWKLFKVRPKESINDVLKALDCPPDTSWVCKQLIQVWNSHIKVQHLRKNEVLLVNPTLLKTHPFGEETLKRLENVKRFRLPIRLRRREPVIRIPKGCKSLSFIRPKD